jgi:outer membrane lipoprotein-sorting protein
MIEFTENYGELLMKKFVAILTFTLLFTLFAFAQPKTNDEKAEAIIKRAIEKLGGEKYLGVKTVYGKGQFTLMKEDGKSLPSKFVDIMVFPNKERTEFKSLGEKTIQTNYDDKGWIFDSSANAINDQKPDAIENFNQTLRVSLDSLLRGYWRGKGTVSYAGKREASLGKRNEVIKLRYDDGFTIEFEFAATDGLPMKAKFTRLSSEKEELKEEDRYAQFVENQGVWSPFIIDHFTNGSQVSRINYESVVYNKPIPDSVFSKPTNLKELKKDLKL